MKHSVTGGVFTLPACSEDAENVYRDKGWVPIDEADGLSKDELVKVAEEHGVVVPPKATKADIAAALNRDVEV